MTPKLFRLCERKGCHRPSITSPKERTLGMPDLCVQHFNEAAGYDPPEGSDEDEGDNGEAPAAPAIDER